MDADDWLKTNQKKLQVVQCNNREMVLFVSHQLERPASDWWDAYVDAHEDCISSTSRTPRHYQDEEERISRLEARVYVCE
jgi:hypothetical protein